MFPDISTPIKSRQEIFFRGDLGETSQQFGAPKGLNNIHTGLLYIKGRISEFGLHLTAHIIHKGFYEFRWATYCGCMGTMVD